VTRYHVAMPNHVDQRLTVTGTPEDVAAFIITARGAAPLTGDRDGFNAHKSLRVTPLSFHSIAPLDDSYSEHKYSDHGCDLERRWWGVKWGPYECDDGVVGRDGASVTYAFQCAWGPPTKALERASRRYRTLRFWLSWGGEGPCRGRHAFVDGATVVSVDDDYKTQIEPDYATDEEMEANEDAAHAKNQAAEWKYINAHESWVDEMLRA
jgi:hypothetical protein